MATLVVQQIALAGVTPSLTHASPAGDQFLNDGKIYIEVSNTDAATRDVTIASSTKCDQGSTHNVVVTIPATTGKKKIGPFPPSRFTDGNGYAQVTYSAETGLTIGAFRLS